MGGLWLLLGALLTWLVGPWGVVLALLALALPPVRRAVRPTRRRVLVAGSVVVLVAAVPAVAVLLLPGGGLPLPPGAGALVAPAYVGGAATARPLHLTVPQHPYLARNGASSMHDDAAASDTYAWTGPLGRDPEVDTAWCRLEECASLAFDRRDRIVALCGNLQRPVLHVIDPDTMEILATRSLPERPASGKKPWEDLCAGAYFYLDSDDRAVLATTDRRVLAVATHDAQDRVSLRTEHAWSVARAVPAGDCLVSLLPGWDGRIWFATQDGRVGTLDPRTGRAAAVVLGEEVANSFAVDRRGAYVVTDQALYHFVVAPTGRPRTAWRAPYDRGTERKPGQLSQGSGTTPTLLGDRLVAITDNAEPRMRVLFVDRTTGRTVCRVAVFAAHHSATENSLVAVGRRSVVVENNAGYAGPLSTVLGRTTSPGVARVDLARGPAHPSGQGRRCRVAWTSPVTAPSSVPKVSLANGLLYAYTLRHTPLTRLLGVSAWYLTALDARTGRTAYSVRTGRGLLFNNHYAAVTLAPDGAAWIATLGGLVRVRDAP